MWGWGVGVGNGGIWIWDKKRLYADADTKDPKILSNPHLSYCQQTIILPG